jgi:hypothetical protein
MFNSHIWLNLLIGMIVVSSLHLPLEDHCIDCKQKFFNKTIGAWVKLSKTFWFWCRVKPKQGHKLYGNKGL